VIIRRVQAPPSAVSRLLSLIVGSSAFAADPREELRALKEQIARQQQQIEALQTALVRQIEVVEALEEQISAAPRATSATLAPEARLRQVPMQPNRIGDDRLSS
jgi:hypothetical protein